MPSGAISLWPATPGLMSARRLPFDQFVSFVMHARRGPPLFHERNEGWTVTDYLLTDLLEMQDVLLCTKTKDPQKADRAS